MRDPPHPNPAPSLAALALPRGEGVSPFTNHESPVTNHQSLMRKLADIERERALRDDDRDGQPALPPGAKNYITPAGYARLKHELQQLLDQERPELVKVIAWAASNGDRSENADYIYGKRRLREIARRIRFLTQRLEIAEVIDP